MTDQDDSAQLELKSIVAFQGNIKNGLVFHRDKNHIVFAVGLTVMIKNYVSGKEYRLSGHPNLVSCIAVSNDGAYIASGQESFMGFRAKTIIWDFEGKNIYGSHNVHQVKVEVVAFSCDSKYLISVGGQDCGNVIVYDVTRLATLCGNHATAQSGGFASILACSKTKNDMFVTAGRNTLRIWRIDVHQKRVIPMDANTYRIKRDIKCIDIDSSNSYVYCGTSSGDIMKLQISVNEEDGKTYELRLVCCLTRVVRKGVLGDAPFYSCGVTALSILKTGDFLIGTGNGVVCRATQVEFQARDPVKKFVNAAKSKSAKKAHEMRLKEYEKVLVNGAVTSIALRGDGYQFLVGSHKSEIYQVTLSGFRCELAFTCHGTAINDIAFPYKCSDLFVTCSKDTIRVWNTLSSKELVRIEVPNMICNSVFVTKDGRCIISGWNDGKIRSHTPETGQLLFCMENAHRRGVTAVAVTSDCRRVISGGGEGEVRVWDVTPTVQVLTRTMKEHRGGITCMRMKSDDRECVTSAGDGSCIIWDLVNFNRLQVVFANTLFKAACYGISEQQILSCGTDRKVSYYETIDGSLVRALEASLSGAINAVDVTPDAKFFVTGGADRLVKVWKYMEGIVTHIGEGHSDEVTALRISHDLKHIVSVGKDGCIIRWKFPQ